MFAISTLSYMYIQLEMKSCTNTAATMQILRISTTTLVPVIVTFIRVAQILPTAHSVPTMERNLLAMILTLRPASTRSPLNTVQVLEQLVLKTPIEPLAAKQVSRIA